MTKAEKKLRSDLIKLASENPDLQSKILPILKSGSDADDALLDSLVELEDLVRVAVDLAKRKQNSLIKVLNAIQKQTGIVSIKSGSGKVTYLW